MSSAGGECRAEGADGEKTPGWKDEGREKAREEEEKEKEEEARCSYGKFKSLLGQGAYKVLRRVH